MRIASVILFVCTVVPLNAWGVDQELAYDDGSSDWAVILNAADDAAAVRFTPPSYPARLFKARFYIVWNTFQSPYYVAWFLDDAGANGSPGDTLLGPILFHHPATSGWVEYVVPETLLINQGDFYIAYLQVTPSLDGAFLGLDTSGPDGRSWRHQDGTWSEGTDPEAGDFMIRAVIDSRVGSVPTEPTTWGRIKALYGETPNN